MLFRNYRLRNTSLCKCLKSHIYVHPRTVNATNSNSFVKETKDFFLNFTLHLRNIYLNWNTWNKKMILVAYVFPNYRLQNTCLCKYLKSHVSVHSGTVNMLKGLKNCCKLHDSSYISFGHHAGNISV